MANVGTLNSAKGGVGSSSSIHSVPVCGPGARRDSITSHPKVKNGNKWDAVMSKIAETKGKPINMKHVRSRVYENLKSTTIMTTGPKASSNNLSKKDRGLLFGSGPILNGSKPPAPVPTSRKTRTKSTDDEDQENGHQFVVISVTTGDADRKRRPSSSQFSSRSSTISDSSSINEKGKAVCINNRENRKFWNTVHCIQIQILSDVDYDDTIFLFVCVYYGLLILPTIP